MLSDAHPSCQFTILVRRCWFKDDATRACASYWLQIEANMGLHLGLFSGGNHCTGGNTYIYTTCTYTESAKIMYAKTYKHKHLICISTIYLFLIYITYSCIVWINLELKYLCKFFLSFPDMCIQYVGWFWIYLNIFSTIIHSYCRFCHHIHTHSISSFHRIQEVFIVL